MPPREDRLADDERDQGGRDHQHERDEAVHDCLRPENRKTSRHCGHRGPDHSGRVLGRDHEHAEHAERKLSELDTRQVDLEGMKVGAVRGTHLRPVVRDDGTGKRSDPDGEAHSSQ